MKFVASEGVGAIPRMLASRRGPTPVGRPATGLTFMEVNSGPLASGSVAAWALGFTVSAPHEPDRAARRCARDLLGRLGCLVDGGAGHRARPVNSVDCMFVARVPSLGEDGSDYLSGSLLRMVRDIAPRVLVMILRPKQEVLQLGKIYSGVKATNRGKG